MSLMPYEYVEGVVEDALEFYFSSKDGEVDPSREREIGNYVKDALLGEHFESFAEGLDELVTEAVYEQVLATAPRYEAATRS